MLICGLQNTGFFAVKRNQQLGNRKTSNVTPMPKSILLVDDNAYVRRGIGAVFEAYGYSICGEAENGKEGVEKAEQLHPDLVILDLSMPVMNGLEAAAVLNQTLPSVPVILLSNYTDALRGELPVGVSALVAKAEAVTGLVSKAKILLRRSA
jgi:CheY-like chemotaxis protein